MLGCLLDAMLNYQEEEKTETEEKKVPYKVPNKVPNKLKHEFPDVTDGTWGVYLALKKNYKMSAEELGKALGISSRMVRKHLASLRERGLIVRVGSNKTGYWKVTI